MRPVPERIAAKEAGERFYFTGKPCRNGHVSKRYTANGLCQICAITLVKRWQAKKREHPKRTAARLAGETHYRTGKRCRNGHLEKRYVSTGQCVVCAKIVNDRWHENHPDAEKQWRKASRARNPQYYRNISKRWAKKHPATHRASRDRWVARHPELYRKRCIMYVQNRKARMNQNGGVFTDLDIDALILKQNKRCAACGKRRKLTVDHVVPVTKGGSNDPSNLQLLCKPCNSSKGVRDHDEWLSTQKRV